jgi:ankyrin repeat protein
LFWACQVGDGPAVQTLLPKVRKVNSRDKKHENYTALHYASKGAQSGIVSLLLKHGADGTARTINYHTPFMVAVTFNRPDRIHELMTASSNVDTETFFHAISETIKKNNPTLLQALLDYVGRKETRLEKFQYALLCQEACTKGNAEMVRMLVETGFLGDRTLRDSHKCISGEPLINLAVSSRNFETVKVLLDNGVAVNTCDRGRTPLKIAADHGDIDVVQLLLDYGADPDLYSPENVIVRVFGSVFNVVDALVHSKSASSNSLGWSTTALAKATSSGHEAVAQLLRERGGTMKMKTKDHGVID